MDDTRVTDEALTARIYLITGKRIMIDEDPAKIYQVSTKRLNEQVRRNLNRFPEDFMFQMNATEWGNLRSQNATSSWGGRRGFSYAFTEHGILMLSSVLKSDRAVLVNIQIMRIFVKLRSALMTQKTCLRRLRD